MILGFLAQAAALASTPQASDEPLILFKGIEHGATLESLRVSHGLKKSGLFSYVAAEKAKIAEGCEAKFSVWFENDGLKEQRTAESISLEAYCGNEAMIVLRDRYGQPDSSDAQKTAPLSRETRVTHTWVRGKLKVVAIVTTGAPFMLPDTSKIYLTYSAAPDAAKSDL